MAERYYISYNKMWKLMIDKKIRKMKLMDKAKISTSTLAKLANDKIVSMDVLIRICRVLGCTFDDILEIAYIDDARVDIADISTEKL